MKSTRRQRRLIQRRIANIKNKYFMILEKQDHAYDLMYDTMHPGGLIIYRVFFHCNSVLKEKYHVA